jgi:HEAT repeat protein
MDSEATPEKWLSWLQYGNHSERKEATLILGGLKPSDPVRLSPLVQALESEDDNLIFWCVIALGRLRSRARRAVPRLLPLLERSAFGIRQAVVLTLSKIAPNDERVKGAILGALKDPSPLVRRQALQAAIVIPHLTKGELRSIRSMENDLDEAVARWSEVALRNIRLRQKRSGPSGKMP